MADLLNRVPPSSQEAEQSILGAMLLSERCVLQAMEKLRAEEFYSQQNRNTAKRRYHQCRCFYHLQRIFLRRIPYVYDR